MTIVTCSLGHVRAEYTLMAEERVGGGKNREAVSQALCDMCRKEPWKYRCPGCSRRSCSLLCVKQHKEEHNCDGKRCKTGYVPLSEFSDHHLLSDYYFLEDVGRFVDSAHREWVYGAQEQSEGDRSFILERVRSVARRRGTELLLLPRGMSLHHVNTSRVVWRKHKPNFIQWRVHLHFPQSGVKYQEEGVPEWTVLSALLERYLHPERGDPIARHQLRRYMERGDVAAVEVFLRVERQKALKPRYYRLEMNKSLCDNLRRKAVLEFPELHVVLRPESQQYIVYEAPNLHIHESHSDQRGGKAHTGNNSGETASKEHMRTDLEATNSQKEVLPTAQCHILSPPKNGNSSPHLPVEHCSSETKLLCSQTTDTMLLTTGLKLIADMYSDDEDEQ